MRLWSIGTVSGLRFVHRSGLLHNDLKLDNILMVRDKSTDRLVPKIADSGLSIRCLKEDGNLIRGQSRYGTTNCAPPECLLHQEVEDMRLMDIWAFGLIVYQLVTNHSPFPVFSRTDRLDPLKLSARVDLLMAYEVREHLPGLSRISEDDRQEFIALLSRLLEPNVLQRKSIEVIAKDSWFQQRERSHYFYKRRNEHQ